jgi:RNA polymerase sigma-70 factor (ECF subfamily)
MVSDLAVSRLDADRERSLVERSRSDASAFAELYDFYLPRIYGFIARRVGERAAAEDLTAMTFERALGTLRRGDFRNESFGGWLYRVASNAIVDHVRHDRRTVSLAAGRAARAGDGQATEEPREDPLALIGDDAATAAFTAALDRDVVRRALTRLPDAQRRVLVLKFFDGLEIEEMCGVLGCSRATFAVRLHRALRALRDAIAEESTDAA